MDIHCERCSKLIPAEDVNLSVVLAKCRGCNAVFDFSRQVQLSAVPEAKAKRDRGELPMPRQFKVEKNSKGVVVTRKWGRGPAYLFLSFALFWNTIVSVFVVIFVASLLNPSLMKSSGDPPPQWFMGLFLTPFVLIGIGMGWMALGLLLNRTTIRVEGLRLQVSHGPIWWPGKRDIPTKDLDQLYCEEYVAYKSNDMPVYRLRIHAICKDGAKIKLVPGMEDAGQALYLEQLLEKQLGIVDRPVSGEYRGGPLG
jgi:hypothetical protein